MTVLEVASQQGNFISYKKISVYYTDLLSSTTGGAALTLTLNGVGGVTSTNTLSNVNSGNLLIPAGAWTIGVRMKVTTLFTGGSLATLTASVGTASGTATNIIAASDVLGATVGTVYAQAASVLTTLNTTTLLPGFNPVVSFAPTTYALSTLTTGQLDIEFLYTSISTTSSSTSYTPGV